MAGNSHPLCPILHLPPRSLSLSLRLLFLTFSPCVCLLFLASAALYHDSLGSMARIDAFNERRAEDFRLPIINIGLGSCRVKGEGGSSNSRRKVSTVFELWRKEGL